MAKDNKCHSQEVPFAEAIKEEDKTFSDVATSKFYPGPTPTLS